MCRRICMFAVCLLFFCVSKADAVVFHAIDTTQPLRCSFSSKHQNRLLIENGVVKKIIIPEGYFSVRLESESGQAILFPSGPFRDFVTITIVTDTGSVQDLEVSLEEKSSEVIILRENSFQQGSPITCFANSERSHEHISLLKRAIANILPPGYAEKGEGSRKRKKMGKGIIAELIKTWEGPYEMIHFFKVQNTGRLIKHLSEKNITLISAKWVYLDNNVLKPSEATMVIIAVSKEGRGVG